MALMICQGCLLQMPWIQEIIYCKQILLYRAIISNMKSVLDCRSSVRSASKKYMRKTGVFLSKPMEFSFLPGASLMPRGPGKVLFVHITPVGINLKAVNYIPESIKVQQSLSANM